MMVRITAWAMVALFALAIVPAYASSGCADKHENVSRFNPTELSDYQKCVFEWKGQKIGTIGKNIWMQHDGGYIYIPMDKLRNKNSDEIKATVVAYIVHETVRTELVEIRTQIEVLKTLDISGELQEKLAARVADLTKASAAATNLVINENAYYPGSGIRMEEINEDAEHDHIVITVGDRQYNIGEKASQMRSVEHPDRTPNTTIHGIDLSDLVEEIRSEVQNAYNDGYSDGYKAGYRDGWNDAVAAMNS